MAKVDINIIKEWFRNLKKPNQDQFWSWLDSFRHKDEAIPMSDVSNLTNTLTKKADLINGVVPENQLPFTINANEVISIGEITTTTNSVTVGVHSSGSNKVRINGQILTRNFSNTLPFTPVTTGNKFLRIVARAETGLFFLREGSESEEPQEPALQSGDVHVRLILVTPTGSEIDPEVLSGFVEKEEESWKTITVSSSTNFSINITDKRTRFKVRSTNDVPKVLQSIVFSEETSRALEIWIYNDTNLNFSIPNSATNGLSKGFTTAQPPFIILPKTYEKLKYNPETNIIECWKVNSTGGGISTVTTDSTMKGDGTSGNPLGLSVSKNAEIAGIQANINAIQIGGRNYILNSDRKNNPIVLNPSSPYSIAWIPCSIEGHKENIPADTYYTLTLWYNPLIGLFDKDFEYVVLGKNSVNGDSWELRFRFSNAKITQDGNFTRAEMVLKAPSGAYILNNNNSIGLIVEPDNNGISLVKSKLEIGNKATDWTPAPEDVDAQISTKQDKSMFSALVDKMVHYYDSATAKMLSTGVEFISAGILKLKSIILTTNSGTALPNELGFDGVNVVFGASKKKLAFKDEIFEHNVRGKVLTATGVNGTYNCDLNVATRWHLTLNGATTLAFTNMILEDETITGGWTITGGSVTFPSWLSKSPSSSDYDGSKVNRITFEITRGGSSPLGRYSIEVYNA